MIHKRIEAKKHRSVRTGRLGFLSTGATSITLFTFSTELAITFAFGKSYSWGSTATATRITYELSLMRID